MFLLRKLAELPPKSRQRKIARILQSLEIDLGRGCPLDTDYAAELARLLSDDPAAGTSARTLGQTIAASAGPAALLRAVNAVRNDLLAALGAEPAEWDFLIPDSGGLDSSSRRVFPAAVFLEDIRSPFNVGSIFRTAEAFGAERILLSPRTPLPTHPRASRTARGAETVVAWQRTELSSLEGCEGVFALELGGTPLHHFRFPPRGTMLVGSEELGLSPEALRLADRALGRVSIPQAGAKRSLNVSAAFAIVMQSWFAGRGAGE